MTARELAGLAKATWAAWLDDYASSMGAALAYYTVFSLAPVVVIVIAIAGLVFGADAARGELVSQLRVMIGPEGAIAIDALLKSASHSSSSIWASVASGLALVLGATSVFAELQSSLDRIWRAPPVAHGGGLAAMLRARLLSFGMVLTIGFLLLVSLVVSTALALVGKWWAAWFYGWATVLQVLNLIISFVTVSLLFAMIYKILPRVAVTWRDVSMGAVVTALLFTLGKFAIGLYLGRSGLVSGFGAAGSLVLILVWVYYSAQIFLLGAEFTWIYAHRHGSRASGAASDGNSSTVDEASPFRVSA